MRTIIALLLICSSFKSFAQTTPWDSLAYPNRWVYDFVVPDSGTFAEAIHAANTRVDKDKRYRIFVKSNYYLIKGDGDTIKTVEKGQDVYFPSPITKLTASNTSIIGENWKDTKIVNIPVHEGISITSTLFLKNADSTYIQDIELWCNFKNDINAFANRAVALNEKRCKGNILKNVSLLSTQDTYYTNDDGTTYLEDCKIHGTVDFICGGGTVFFNTCDIILRPRGKTGSRDVICAPATKAEQKYGYVFNFCDIDGSPEQQDRYNLGRPWKNAPRAVFLNTKMKVRPSAQGWTEMHGMVPRLFAEYKSVDNNESSIDLSLRKRSFKNKQGETVIVDYQSSLTAEEAKEYTVEKVFPDWNPKEACKQVAPPYIWIKGRKTISWNEIPDAYCYAICINGDVKTFTRQANYVVPADTEEGACISIRCANWHGGLGPASNEVVYPNR
ncbi:MAG: hypothetical protein K6E54_02435 [Bacteroidaceae bacterium]|nr:hypothetical protein [Bacteroidaceae bacterium]